MELTLKSLAFRSAKHVLLSSLSLMVRSLLRRYCAQVIHCIQILMLLALTPIGFLRLNPIDLHQRKLLCEFTKHRLQMHSGHREAPAHDLVRRKNDHEGVLVDEIRDELDLADLRE